MAVNAVYITWRETETVFDGRTPDKYNTLTPDFRPVVRTRRTLYSMDATSETLAAAKAYITEYMDDRSDAKAHIVSIA
jgi:hypothetical protein